MVVSYDTYNLIVALLYIAHQHTSTPAPHCTGALARKEHSKRRSHTVIAGLEEVAMRKAQAESEESVQATASDAAVGKLSAASLGYFEDRFLEVLVGATPGTDATAATAAAVRRLPPVINRGADNITSTAASGAGKYSH